MITQAVNNSATSPDSACWPCALHCECAAGQESQSAPPPPPSSPPEPASQHCCDSSFLGSHNAAVRPAAHQHCVHGVKFTKVACVDVTGAGVFVTRPHDSLLRCMALFDGIGLVLRVKRGVCYSLHAIHAVHLVCTI